MRAPVKTILSVLLTSAGLVPAQDPPTFTSDTQDVLLDQVARDKKGKPVADLRRDEVQVFEDGTRCEIESFRLVRAPGKDEPAPPQAAPSPGRAGSAPETATPSRANLVVLVFDVLPVATAPLARQGALDLLSKEFPANTWFAVFKMDRRGMRPLQAFTSDRARLASAVDFATRATTRGAPAPRRRCRRPRTSPRPRRRRPAPCARTPHPTPTSPASARTCSATEINDVVPGGVPENINPKDITVPQDPTAVPYATMGPYGQAFSDMLNSPAFGNQTLEELENARIAALQGDLSNQFGYQADEMTRRLNQEAAAKGMFTSGARVGAIGRGLSELGRQQQVEFAKGSADIRGERPELLLQEREQRANIANMWGQMDQGMQQANLDAMLNNKLMEYERQAKNGELTLSAFEGNINKLSLFLNYMVSSANTANDSALISAQIDKLGREATGIPTPTSLYWPYEMWNNRGDTAYLYNETGTLVSSLTR